MEQLTIEQIYNGEKYNVMSAVVSEYLKNGRPKEYDERIWIELLIVKHSINAAHKMQKKGDTVSGMTDDVSPSSYVEVEQ